MLAADTNNQKELEPVSTSCVSGEDTYLDVDTAGAGCFFDAISDVQLGFILD